MGVSFRVLNSHFTANSYFIIQLSCSERFRLHGAFFERNEAQKNALDWIEFDGVDERIGGKVKEEDQEDNVVAADVECHVRSEVGNQIKRGPGQHAHSVECADHDHRLDHVGLNLV